jgi:hypothetical protein
MNDFQCVAALLIAVLIAYAGIRSSAANWERWKEDNHYDEVNK